MKHNPQFDIDYIAALVQLMKQGRLDINGVLIAKQIKQG